MDIELTSCAYGDGYLHFNFIFIFRKIFWYGFVFLVNIFTICSTSGLAPPLALPLFYKKCKYENRGSVV